MRNKYEQWSRVILVFFDMSFSLLINFFDGHVSSDLNQRKPTKSWRFFFSVFGVHG